MDTIKKHEAVLLEHLLAISPLDGRYKGAVSDLSAYFSEYALIKTRIEVEIQYLLFLSENNIIRSFSEKEKTYLETFIFDIKNEVIQEVKLIENKTRHDVKAVERMLRSRFSDTSLVDVIEMLHIGLTSEDINNISYRLLIKRGTKNVVLPLIEQIISVIKEMSEEYKALSMLARTHGQSAVPTTLGKELSVFLLRLYKQYKLLTQQELTGKVNGAVGNFNALHVAFPEIDWIIFSEKFITSLGLVPNIITSQINPYEDVIELFQIYGRINTILIDFNQDIWRYISDHWFIQTVRKGEVGSSTMPQKVNPIDFENSEGNLGMANSMIEFFSRKLPVSRLQRDLSDSTVMRNIGVCLGYCVLGYKSVLVGLSRVRANEEKITKDLNYDYTILTEAVQTLLRREGVEDPYTLISSLTRGERVDPAHWKKWIERLPVEKKLQEQLAILTPQSYLGYAEELTIRAIKEIKLQK